MEETKEVETEVETEVEESKEVETEEKEESKRLSPEQEKAIKQRTFKKLAKELGVELEKPKSEKTEIKSKSNEPDYGRLAYLNSSGINHSDDQKIVQDEADRLQLPLTEVLQMEHVKSRLQANKDQREALAGTPKGTGRSGGKTQNDVDYWLSKEGDERPADQELAAKVLQAKQTKEKQAHTFSDQMYS